LTRFFHAVPNAGFSFLSDALKSTGVEATVSGPGVGSLDGEQGHVHLDCGVVAHGEIGAVRRDWVSPHNTFTPGRPGNARKSRGDGLGCCIIV